MRIEGAAMNARPVHVACLLCDPPPEFFTLYHLSAHYFRDHPLSMQPGLCICGHPEGAHNTARTRRYCQAANTAGQCPCDRYVRQEAA